MRKTKILVPTTPEEINEFLEGKNIISVELAEFHFARHEIAQNNCFIINWEE